MNFKEKNNFPSLLQTLTNYLVGGTTPTKRKNKLNKNKDSSKASRHLSTNSEIISYIELHTRYSTIEKTNTFKHLIDYLLYIYELKYKH